VQVNLAKTVLGSLVTAYAIVANVTDWPRIVDLIKNVELLARPSRRGDATTRATDFVRPRQYAGHGSGKHQAPHRLRFIVRHPILHDELDYRPMGFTAADVAGV
jgi:hypothetical protein